MRAPLLLALGQGLLSLGILAMMLMAGAVAVLTYVIVSHQKKGRARKEDATLVEVVILTLCIVIPAGLFILYGAFYLFHYLGLP